MLDTLTELCEEIKNFFIAQDGYHFGKFTISDGEIEPLDFIQDGQFFRIVGSAFNDGIYKKPASASELTDETFDGAIWAMNVPPAVLALCNEIEQFNKSDAAKPSVFTSESFGGYSYSKATNSNGAPMSWQDVFARRLNKWRKI